MNAKQLWYQRNKENHIAKVKLRRSEKREFVIQYKMDHSFCTDCRVEYPYFILEFDHLPQFKKSFPLSAAGSKDRSKEKIIEEIAKCEIVCANCHRIRTHRRNIERKLGRTT